MPGERAGRVVDHVLPAPAHGERDPASLAPGRQRHVRLGAPWQPADDRERPLRPVEERAGTLDVVRRRMDTRRRERPCIPCTRVLDEHVLGQREHDRPRAPGRRDVERPRDELRDPVGAVDLLDPFRHRPEHLAVVDLLECLAPRHLPAHLADQEEQRRRVLKGGVDPAGGMRRARATRDHADARAARELPVGVGHVRRPDLVPAGDEPERRVVEGIEHREVALTGDAEREVGAVHDQLVDEKPAARPHATGRRSACSRYTVAFWSFGRSSSAAFT